MSATMKSATIKSLLAQLQAPEALVVQVSPKDAKEIITFVGRVTEPAVLDAMSEEYKARLLAGTQRLLDAVYGERLRFDARWTGVWAGNWFYPTRLALSTLRARLRGPQEPLHAEDLFGV